MRKIRDSIYLVTQRSFELVLYRSCFYLLPLLLVAEGAHRLVVVGNPCEVLDDQRARTRVQQPVVG